MNTKQMEFVVSTADWAFYLDGMLACTGVANLTSSLSTSMQEQAVNAGRHNKKIFSYKYGRELKVELEAANWALEYLALQTGTAISKGMKDFYSMNECVTLKEGKGNIAFTPIEGASVCVQLPSGEFVKVTSAGTQIDLTSYGLTDGKVKATYQYKTMGKRLTIDADSNPCVGELVLQAEKHNSKKGKIGMVEIDVPSYSLDGNFDISFTPEGVTSTKMSGSALAVEGETCEDGSAVYAYITETDTEDVTSNVSEIAIVAPVTTMKKSTGTINLTVVGIMGALYKPMEIDPSECTFVVSEAGSTGVKVGDKTGIVSGASTAGKATIKATYGKLTDTVEITVID